MTISFISLVISFGAFTVAVIALILNKNNADRVYALEKLKLDMDQSVRSEAEMSEREKTILSAKLLCAELERLRNKLAPLHKDGWASLNLYVTGINHERILDWLTDIGPSLIPKDEYKVLSIISGEVKELVDRDMHWVVQKGREDHRKLISLDQACERLINILDSYTRSE